MIATLFSTTRRTLLLFAFLTVSILPVLAGPWLPGARKGFVQLGYSGLYYNSVFGSNGSELVSFRNTSDVTLQLYAEYCIGEKWGIRGCCLINCSVPDPAPVR